MKLIDKINAMLIKTRIKAVTFFKDERGDTNFISILVILGIALALAAVFLTFKDQIIAWVDANIGDFFNMRGGR